MPAPPSRRHIFPVLQSSLSTFARRPQLGLHLTFLQAAFSDVFPPGFDLCDEFKRVLRENVDPSINDDTLGLTAQDKRKVIDFVAANIQQATCQAPSAPTTTLAPVPSSATAAGAAKVPSSSAPPTSTVPYQAAASKGPHTPASQAFGGTTGSAPRRGRPGANEAPIAAKDNGEGPYARCGTRRSTGYKSATAASFSLSIDRSATLYPSRVATNAAMRPSVTEAPAAPPMAKRMPAKHDRGARGETAPKRGRGGTGVAVPEQRRGVVTGGARREPDSTGDAKAEEGARGEGGHPLAGKPPVSMLEGILVMQKFKCKRKKSSKASDEVWAVSVRVVVLRQR